MGLLDDLNAPPAKTWSCRVRTLAIQLEEKDLAIFEEAISNPEWKAETLSKALAQRGLRISGSVITRHRMKECSCLKVNNA